MEFGFATILLLPFGLGLLGFIEPCTIGAHLIFLSAQAERNRNARVAALASFIIARMVVMGGFGGLVGLVGHWLIDLQTGFWLAFGLLYVGIGIAFVFGRAGLVKRRLAIAPEAWRRARNPLLMGAAFGLNIPACAAPILFGLLGLAVSGGSVLAGFTMMAVFAFALSAPLILMALEPRFAGFTMRAAEFLRTRPWLVGPVFFGLGIWSIYFGLFVDPIDWSGL